MQNMDMGAMGGMGGMGGMGAMMGGAGGMGNDKFDPGVSDTRLHQPYSMHLDFLI